MFIAKRTERDGYLVAYEGEAMTEAEAVRRGLMPEPKPEPVKKAPAKKSTTRKPAAKKTTKAKEA